jgi:ATP-dependent RNA helicase DeaD
VAFNVGEKAGVRKGDLVGAITGETGLTSKSLGAIKINPDFSVVDVEASVANKVVRTMKGRTIRGHRVDVKRMD